MQDLEVMGEFILSTGNTSAKPNDGTEPGRDREVYVWYDTSARSLRGQMYSLETGTWHEIFGVTDFFLEIAAGNVPGHSAVTKFGRNPDIDQIASSTAVIIGRDIWDLGIAGATMWVPPTTARIHQIASSNDEDGGAGGDTGALTMEVYGLDSSFALTNETITLNGTTNAPTSAMTMIYRMECLTFGSAGRNLGNILATADTDGTVTAQVTADNSQTLMAIYQIPAGKTGYITSYESELHKTGGAATLADITLMSMKFGGGWRVRDTMSLASDGTTSHQKFFQPYKTLAAKEYVKVVGAPSKDAQDIGAGFALILKDD